jgi:predicted solute-binding protein
MHLISIDNLSARAYRLSVPPFPHSLRFASPARSAELMTAGRCDAALVPVAALPGLSAVAEPVGNFGVACRGAVGSVQMFSEYPLESLLYSRRPIYATTRSRSSVQLFTLLCARVYGALPTLTTTFPDAAGRLLIGDTAFEYAQRVGGGPHNVDLGAWWHDHTGLPFVYARWVAARGMGAEQRLRLQTWLERCGNLAQSPEGVSQLAETYEAMPGDQRILRDYYQRVHPVLSEEDLAGEACFHSLTRDFAHANVTTVA